uniref:F-box protein At5g65850-like n=1 Tax=Erigeron canadensis TaxID=72917 RepID=UPI001CB9614B|nr:F-box protein At5g65850-like [Erigeron canadensis]
MTNDDHDDQQPPQKTAKNSIPMPTEIIEEIVLRLPVKSILRFSAVSKQWLSFISHPSFAELHFTRKSNHTSLLITAYDCTSKRHYLQTAPHNGGPVIDFLTDYCIPNRSESQHLNGLVLFTSNKTPHANYPYVINPSTRKSYELTFPYSTYDTHQSFPTNNLKKLPVGMTAKMHCFPESINSVCVNNVIHMTMFMGLRVILAFDLRTETFSVMNVPRELDLEEGNVIQPYLMNINGLLGVVCFRKTNELHIWMLQDYENRTWVREIVPLYVPWNSTLGCRPYPLGSTNLEEIVFSQIMCFPRLDVLSG